MPYENYTIKSGPNEGKVKRVFYPDANQTNRKTLKILEKVPYPTPEELYEEMMTHNWPYKRNADNFILRDRAFIAMTYLLGSRESESLRITKKHIRLDIADDKAIPVDPFPLSKSKHGSIPRKHQFRDGFLPLVGDRAMFTKAFLEYYDTLKNEDEDRLLFPIVDSRIRQIALKTIPKYCTHWLRAFCEDKLYVDWKFDIVGVADYVKVDVKTVEGYLRSGWKRSANRAA